MVIRWMEMLFRGLGSGLCEAAAATTSTLPAAWALTMMENCAEARLASAARVQVNTLACRAQPEVHDTSDSAYGSRTPATTLLAVPGPALATVSVQVPVPPTVMLAGQDNTAEMSASEDALVTVTVNGPAVAAPTVLVAVTE